MLTTEDLKDWKAGIDEIGESRQIQYDALFEKGALDKMIYSYKGNPKYNSFLIWVYEKVIKSE
ncbi:MAG: hypothetical protein WC623_24290 [Pedobacter sp.]|uniref:hypothetical protein n=1 Tax=Pedobacter sp. TaxID=1411316 RepID=UPI003566B4BE